MMAQDLRDNVAKRAEITKRGNSGSVHGFLEDLKPQLARALPRHMSADRLARIALTEVRRTPLLAKCTPESFAGALLTCAQLGLEPGVSGEAWLLPFRNGKTGQYEVNFIIGYPGMCKLFWQHPLAASLDAGVVREGDEFDYAKGTSAFLHHKPADERGRPLKYYAVATLSSGGSHFVVMTPEDIEAIRVRSKAKDDGPWATDHDAMAMKTCIRQLFKLLPRSAEMSTALAAEDGTYTAPTDLTFTDEPDPAGEPEEAPASKESEAST